MNPAGPLRGIKVVEIASIGPGPFCGMVLSDLGASVLRIERHGGAARPSDVTRRGRWSVALDLKNSADREQCLAAIASGDALSEGFRPGVMERLGLGPDVALASNPRLVYARVTGWGQSGPYSQAAGHDLNYNAISGALAAIGSPNQPLPPLNLLGDYAGGALFATIGILAALLHARATGEGQVIDAAMAEGAASLMATFCGLVADGKWSSERGSNVLDGGAPFYQCYRCADGEWISIAPMEPQFYEILLDRLSLPRDVFASREDRGNWPLQKAALADLFASMPRAHWCSLLEGTDVCFAPLMSLRDAPSHPHNKARQTFVELEGVMQPAPVPRFSRTPTSIQAPPRVPAENFEESFNAWSSGLRAS